MSWTYYNDEGFEPHFWYHNLNDYLLYYVAAYIIYNAIYCKIVNKDGDRNMAINGISDYLIQKGLVDTILIINDEHIKAILNIFFNSRSRRRDNKCMHTEIK